MTDDEQHDVHPDLAAFRPAPLEPYERMQAVSARLISAAKLPGPLAYPIRHSMAMLGGALEKAAEGHQAADDGMCAMDRPGLPCLARRIADVLLGEEPTW